MNIIEGVPKTHALIQISGHCVPAGAVRGISSSGSRSPARSFPPLLCLCGGVSQHLLAGTSATLQTPGGPPETSGRTVKWGNI